MDKTSSVSINSEKFGVYQWLLISLLLVSLFNAHYLSVSEYLRLFVVLVVMLLVFFKWDREGLKKSTRQTEENSSDKVTSEAIFNYAVWVPYIIVVSMLFIITQFDPVLQQNGLLIYGINSYFYAAITTVIIIILSVVYFSVNQRYYSFLNKRDKIDNLVLSVGIAVLFLALFSRIIISEKSIDIQFVFSEFKIISYMLLWCTIKSSCGQYPLARVKYGDIIAWSWVGRVYATIVSVIAIALGIGVYQVTDLYYNLNNGESHFASNKYDMAINYFNITLSKNETLNVGSVEDKALDKLFYIYATAYQDSAAVNRLINDIKHKGINRSGIIKVGNILLKYGFEKKAIEFYIDYLNSSKEFNANVINQLGTCYMRMENSREFIHLIRKYDWPEVAPVSYSEFVFMGNIAIAKKEQKKAAHFFEEAANLDFHDSYSNYMAGKILTQLEKPQEAIIYLNRLRPNSDVHFWLGVCSELIGDIDKAKKEYLKTIELAPSHVEALHKLVQISDTSPLVNELLRKSTPQIKTDIDISAELKVLGYTVVKNTAQVGESFVVRVYWFRKHVLPIPESYHIAFLLDTRYKDMIFRNAVHFDDDELNLSKWGRGTVFIREYSLPIVKSNPRAIVKDGATIRNNFDTGEYAIPDKAEYKAVMHTRSGEDEKWIPTSLGIRGLEFSGI
jgi:tetratricopeptide (TPR) repeat protein